MLTKEKADKKTTFRNSTIGMQVRHENMSKSGLVRVEFYNTEQGNICLQAISGLSLAPINCIKQVFITSEEYNDRPFDYYDQQVEYWWALRKLGFNFED